MFFYQDVENSLIPRLPHLTGSYHVPYPDWNHIDFLWGIDAKELVYEDLFKQIETVF